MLQRGQKGFGEMTHGSKFPPIFFFFFSSYICYQSTGLGLGSWRKPGPGFLSFWSGVVLGVLALVVLFQSWKLKEDEEESKTRSSWRGKILCFVSLLVFVLLLNTLGFIPTSFLFMGFLIKIVERKSWATAGLIAFAVALASYGLFEICLHSQLPKGILEFLGI